MKKAITQAITAVVLLFLVSASPLLAIGPSQGAEQSDNDNFVNLADGLLNLKGVRTVRLSGLTFLRAIAG